MSHPTLFDLVPTLPHQGVTPEARHCSRAGARAAAPRRGRLQQRYVDALLRLGVVGLTDAEAATRLEVPISSICSTRAALRDHLAPAGYRTGRYGTPNTVYVLKVQAGVRFDRRED